MGALSVTTRTVVGSLLFQYVTGVNALDLTARGMGLAACGGVRDGVFSARDDNVGLNVAFEVGGETWRCFFSRDAESCSE